MRLSPSTNIIMAMLEAKYDAREKLEAIENAKLLAWAITAPPPSGEIITIQFNTNRSMSEQPLGASTHVAEREARNPATSVEK